MYVLPTGKRVVMKEAHTATLGAATTIISRVKAERFFSMFLDFGVHEKVCRRLFPVAARAYDKFQKPTIGEVNARTMLGEGDLLSNKPLTPAEAHYVGAERMRVLAEEINDTALAQDAREILANIGKQLSKPKAKIDNLFTRRRFEPIIGEMNR